MYPSQVETGLKAGSWCQVVQIPYWQRWQVWQRLQELSIPAWCLSDGQLHVEIRDGMAAVQLRSVVQQFRAPRPELVAWMEQCWRISAR